MNLIKKEVEFDGKKILGIMENGKIYVSVKAVCIGMDMSKNQMDVQVKKIQKDELLKGAAKLTHFNTNGGIQTVLAIELDYLPAWLFKINPSRFNDDLKQNLLAYQLKAKDVLADAFLGERKVAIDWDRMTFAQQSNKTIIYLGKKMDEDIKEVENLLRRLADYKTHIRAYSNQVDNILEEIKSK
ncbi:MAG: phage antirepressor N-terminal domain-containing protein [Cetobacterium sp.]